MRRRAPAMIHVQVWISIQILNVLVEAGGEALLLMTNIAGFSCLQAACDFGNLDIVKTLIEAGGEALLFTTDKAGVSCIVPVATGILLSWRL
jgi:hypothetical protein